MARRLLLLAILVALGLGSKVYEGPGASWIRGSSGGICYVAFWIVAWLCIRPRTHVGKLAVIVFVATCLVEVSQLWHPEWLDAIRRTTPGGLVLGWKFTWVDFPPYAIGAVLGYACGRWSSPDDE